MALSNTVTPIIYGEFRERVLRGEIQVNQEVAWQMERIDERILDPRFYYDPDPLFGWIDFCENELTLTDGSEVHMMDTFKLWGEDLLCWYYFTEKEVWVPDDHGGGHYEYKTYKMRLVNDQWIILGRGGAKTMYQSFIQAYWLCCVPVTSHQIATSPTMRQTDECLSPIRTAITKARGPMFKWLTHGSRNNTKANDTDRVKLESTKAGIVNRLTNSLLEPRPMSIDKLQSIRCLVATVDEWLSCEIRENPITAIEQSASKNDNYVIIAVSSEGTVRNGVGDDIKLQLIKILKGEIEDEHTSIWYYKLDSVDEVADPSKWQKAQPNIGVTVSYEVYQREVDKAMSNPAVQNEILAKRFNLPRQGYKFFFTYEETRLFDKFSCDKLPCALGMDASRGDDFWTMAHLFRLGQDVYAVKTRSYISRRTYDLLPESILKLYDKFIHEGSLVVMDGITLDGNEIYDDWYNWAMHEHQYQPVCYGFDPYNADAFNVRYYRDFGEFMTTPVRQGKRTETVPLGEIKQIVSARQLVFDESIVQFALGNAIVLYDDNGQCMLHKSRKDNKIDPVAAIMDAYVAEKTFKEVF